MQCSYQYQKEIHPSPCQQLPSALESKGAQFLSDITAGIQTLGFQSMTKSYWTQVFHNYLLKEDDALDLSGEWWYSVIFKIEKERSELTIFLTAISYQRLG